MFKSFLKGSRLLSLLFLAFIFYVGLAPLPEFVKNTLSFPGSGISPGQYIKNTDLQYQLMLSTDPDIPLLQNKGAYINLNGFMARVLGQPCLNQRVLLKNGHLTMISDHRPEDAEIQAVARNLAALSQAQTNRGKHFLFVLAPTQITPWEDLLPPGYTDTANETADRLLQQLEVLQVPFLDLRQSMQDQGITAAEAFFRTDHHWTAETGFWAYAEIIKAMASKEAIAPVDSYYTDPENYDFRIYPNTFLGTSGVRTGYYYVQMDDFCLINPKFETDITVRILPPEGMEEVLTYQGPYGQSVNTPYPEDFYTDPDYFSKALYGIYGRSDTPPAYRLNPDAPQPGRFLLMGDSFTNVPFSLFSIYTQDSCEVDMRAFHLDFPQFYQDYDPDTVVLLVNAGNCLEENASYPFFPE